jgi:DNA-binding HxlR family transcriptional regulator
MPGLDFVKYFDKRVKIRLNWGIVRTYGQYCAIAKALDVVGDRWTLLIVRELLLAGPRRYTDLRDALPGIATNLLAARLRELDHAGLVRSEHAPPPVATTLYALTERGEALAPVLRELGRWGVPVMAAGPAEGDSFRSHWLSFPVSEFLADNAPADPPAAIELRTGEEPVVIEARGGSVQLVNGPAAEPGLILAGEPHVLLGLLSGALDTAQARARGLDAEGDTELLKRVIPQAPPRAA